MTKRIETHQIIPATPVESPRPGLVLLTTIVGGVPQILWTDDDEPIYTEVTF